MNSVPSESRRRRRPRLLVAALSITSVSSFIVPPQPTTTSLHMALSEVGTTNHTDTWSRRSSESRFGVRRRVRNVLEKARGRTGRSNYSVVAEAASIGGAANLRLDNERIENELNNVFNMTDPVVMSEPTSGVDVDALLASEKVTIDPLPFTLPRLSDEQLALLASGERIQEQSKMGREGSGFVVLDVDAPPYVVWECLLDFERYPDYISTVRSMRMFTNNALTSSYLAEKPVLPGAGRSTRHYGNASISRASFVLSKFQLNIAAVHKYQPHPAGHYMIFTLDKACKNMVLKDAKGIWYTETDPDGKQGTTRIWLLCEVKVSSVLPSMIVDYVAKRAMPRATNWLRPVVEQVRKEMLMED